MEAIKKADEELRSRNYELGIKGTEETIIRNSKFVIHNSLSEPELAKLKKMGIRWMKVGLRMDEAFEIFERRIKEMIMEDKVGQLRLPLYS